MADKQSRLAEIYKAEKSKGGGIASTLGKRALEKMDPRKFFNQKGFLAASLPSLFKSYSATPTKTGEKLASAGGGSFSSGVLETKMDILTGETRELKIHSKIAAKNSESLPIMARDMNLMRQNITKLVKLQGGTAASKADMFFMKSGERESAYENRFGKEGGKSKTPTQIGAAPKEEKKKGIFDSILDFLPTIFKGLLAAGIIGQFLQDPETFKIVKEFATKVLIKFFDGVTATFNMLSDLFNDPEVQKSISKAINSIIGAIGDFLSIKLTKLFDTPFGEVNLTIGGAIATVIAGFVAFKAAIATLTTSVLQAAGKIAMGGRGPATTGPAGPAGPAGGKGPNKGPIKGGSGIVGTVLALTAMAAPFALSMFNKKPEELTEEEIQAANEAATKKFIEKNGREPTENDLSNVQALEQSKSNIKDAALTVGANAVGVVGSAYAVKQSVSGMSTGSKVQGYNTSAKRFTDASGKFTSAKDLPKGEMIKKFMDFAVKAQSKGWIGKLYGKLALRLGQSIAIKAAAFIGGLTVPGIGTAVALISLASLAYDAYNIYEAIFGENGILDELEKEDKLNNVSQTPPQTPTDNTTPTPVPYNAAADSQAANTTSVKATPTAPSSAGAYRGQRSDMSPTKSSTTPVTTGSGGAAFGMYPKPGGIQSDLMAAFAQEGITDEKTQIALLANIKKESGFKPISENLNYTSTARLKEVFPSRTKNLSDEELKRYTNNPQGLAELVYGGRMGNAEPGDGFKYRGRGFIQLTGKNNYASMGAALNLPLVDNPDLANDPVVAARIAARYIKDANLQKSFNTQEEANRAVTQSIGGSNLNLNSGYGASLLSKVNSYAGDISLASSAGTSSPNPVVASASAPYSTPASSPDLKMPTMGTLAAAAPTMGDMIEAATSAFSDITRVFDTAMASVTNVTNNNTQSSAGGQQSQGALPSVYDDVFLSLFQRVT